MQQVTADQLRETLEWFTLVRVQSRDIAEGSVNHGHQDCKDATTIEIRGHYGKWIFPKFSNIYFPRFNGQLTVWSGLVDDTTSFTTNELVRIGEKRWGTCNWKLGQSTK